MLRSLVISALFATLTLFSATSAIGQSESTITEDEFSFKLPDGYVLEKSKEMKDSRTYHFFGKGYYLFVFSDPDFQGSRFLIVSRYFERNIDEIDLKGKTKGWFGEFDYADGYHHYSFVARTKNRYYVFHAIATSAEVGAARDFIRSIRHGAQSIDFKLSQPKAPEARTEVPTPRTEIPNPNTRSDGSGSGQGNGPGRGATKVEVPERVPMTPIKILSRPRPEYNDLARTFGIQGTTILKVVFRADGTIGAVEPWTTLPLGLTYSAIEAAKAIKFEPARRNGQPYTVVKNIEYSFRLF